jgi:phosphonate transport system permease protein
MIREMSVSEAAPRSLNVQRSVQKTHTGKIRIAAYNRSALAVRLVLLALFGLTVLGFLTFNYKNIDLGEAISSTFANVKTVFALPRLTHDTAMGLLYQLLVTFCLGLLSTLFGAVIAFFFALLCARNIASPRVATVVKGIMAFIRAVPTILWVLVFAVSAGLGSIAAVSGLVFHSVSYLTKAYAESIEEIDSGTIEALKASGGNFWQIVFQAIVPSSIGYMLAWTFLRFEINFTNAIAMGAAAGAGGIGYNLFMAGSFYFDLRELGYITYAVVIAVMLLETAATRIKAIAK